MVWVVFKFVRYMDSGELEFSRRNELKEEAMSLLQLGRDWEKGKEQDVSPKNCTGGRAKPWEKHRPTKIFMRPPVKTFWNFFKLEWFSKM